MGQGNGLEQSKATALPLRSGTSAVACFACRGQGHPFTRVAPKDACTRQVGSPATCAQGQADFRLSSRSIGLSVSWPSRGAGDALSHMLVGVQSHLRVATAWYFTKMLWSSLAREIVSSILGC